MAFSQCEMLLDYELPDGHNYKVVIETGMQGLARLNVACLKPDSDDEVNSQGADLTAAECRALAKMLNATADLIDADDVLLNLSS